MQVRSGVVRRVVPLPELQLAFLLEMCACVYGTRLKVEVKAVRQPRVVISYVDGMISQRGLKQANAMASGSTVNHQRSWYKHSGQGINRASIISVSYRVVSSIVKKKKVKKSLFSYIS